MRPANDPAEAQFRRALAGSYELEGLLGRGGMASCTSPATCGWSGPSP